MKVFKDGNKWCAVDDDFVNLKKSRAGFGDTKFLAVRELYQGRDTQRMLAAQARYYEFLLLATHNLIGEKLGSSQSGEDEFDALVAQAEIEVDQMDWYDEGQLETMIRRAGGIP